MPDGDRCRGEMRGQRLEHVVNRKVRERLHRGKERRRGRPGRQLRQREKRALEECAPGRAKGARRRAAESAEPGPRGQPGPGCVAAGLSFASQMRRLNASSRRATCSYVLDGQFRCHDIHSGAYTLSN